VTKSSENDRLIDFNEMASGSFVFSWTVAATGYQWADATSPFHDKKESSRWLIDPTPAGVQGEWRRYAPLRHRGLHRRFAKLAPTEEAILGFANKYGLLDGGELPLKVTGSSGVFGGEQLDLWVEEIKHMALLVRLWDLQKRNASDLAQYVWWQEDGTVRIPVACYWDERVGRWAVMTLDRDAEDPYRKILSIDGPIEVMSPVISAPFLHPRLARLWGKSDARGPLAYFVSLKVNERMRGHVSPAVIPLRDGDIRMVPDSLRAALWLHLAFETSGRQRKSLECLGCGEYFPPTHGRQKYHDEACRKRSWRPSKGG
jgi:hypothetical protein